MQTNKKKAITLHMDNNLSKTSMKIDKKELKYPYNHDINQSPGQGSVKDIGLSMSSSALEGRLGTYSFRNEKKEYEKMIAYIWDHEMKKRQITDEELADENGHGNIL